MFEPVFESLRKATDATVQMQQELFSKWTTMFPALPMVPAAYEPLKFQKRCVEVIAELTRKQRESLEAQFNTGVKTIEESFRLCEAKGPEELRTKTVELWQKTFDSLRQVYDAQVKDFQTATAKWAELVTRGVA
jgi:hypothetical protein